MRAVDTNVLVYAEIRTSRWHDRARAVLAECAEGAAAWAIPWPCVYEFLRVITHPKVYHPPVPTEIALADLRSLLASPSLILLSATPRHGDVMDAVVRSSGVTGNLTHDAHIAALCIEHGVTELLTGDRDFHRFKELAVVDPFR
jgi:hypothetical protein